VQETKNGAMSGYPVGDEEREMTREEAQQFIQQQKQK
jgi:hypothetical protein